MNVPIEWLSEYVKLPKTGRELTDRLTAIGHMLDKTKEVGGQDVIDLELRGNRADMLGIWGIAREVGAAFNVVAKAPQITTLPPKDKSHPLVTVEKNAQQLVTRFEALRLRVKIAPSPKWLVKRLEALDIPAINNVVDVTNYVMMETGEPLHAFDYNKLSGGRLILRRAKDGERFITIQQGLEVTLTSEDLVICDEKSPQTLTVIGGLHSKVTEQTAEILLEAAVYNQANARRSSRRLKIFTNGSARHEKHLDPNQIEFALQRAVHLLQQTAQAQVVGETSDYYPNPVKPKTINFQFSEVDRLTGTVVSEKEAVAILQRLQFEVNKNKITVPTFRTDIEGSADIVEEVIRIYGYDRIPATPIADPMPIPKTYPSQLIQERLRDHMTSMGFDEVITLTMVPNDWAPDGVRLVNPPDPDRAALRSSLLPSLKEYANRLLNFNIQRVAIFEIGNVFSKSGSKYRETVNLGFAVAGYTTEKQWNSESQPIDIHYLSGVLQTLLKLLGIETLGKIQYSMEGNIYGAELDVEEILKLAPKFSNPYQIVSTFASLVEDYNVTSTNVSYGNLRKKVEAVSPFVKEVKLVDRHGDKLTIRVTYHSDKKQLSSQDIAPLRVKLTALGSE